MRIPGIVSGVLIVAGGLLHALPATNTPKVDKTITREVDITRDEKPERIVLHVTGKDIHSPFTWTITIFSGTRRIFYSTKTDPEKFDNIFSETKLFDDCGNPESCKMKWYFVDIMKLFLYPLKADFLKLMKNKEFGPFTTFDDIKDLILKTGRASLDQAIQIVDDLKRDIENGKAVCINPNVSPVSMGPIYLWIPIIDDFVYIYDD